MTKAIHLQLWILTTHFIASEVKEILSRVVGEECKIIFINGEKQIEICVYELDRQSNFDYTTGVLVEPFSLTDKQEYNLWI